MSKSEKYLKHFETKLLEAKQGDSGALKFLRQCVAKSAITAPDEDLIEIADFIGGFLRRHIKGHVEGN